TIFKCDWSSDVSSSDLFSAPRSRNLSSLPAENLKLRDRGALKKGYFADIVIFDPAKIEDHSTFEKPHQYSTGVRDVFVNGVQVRSEERRVGKECSCERV